MTEIFERLGFAVKYANGVWTVTSASWRFDIEIEEDLLKKSHVFMAITAFQIMHH